MTQGPQMAFTLCVISGIACAYIAKKKGRSPAKWGGLGFFIMGPFAFILIYAIVGAIVGSGVTDFKVKDLQKVEAEFKENPLAREQRGRRF